MPAGAMTVLVRLNLNTALTAIIRPGHRHVAGPVLSRTAQPRLATARAIRAAQRHLHGRNKAARDRLQSPAARPATFPRGHGRISFWSASTRFCEGSPRHSLRGRTENVARASGSVDVGRGARAAPDGYTLVID
jgi:hypothetical protein